jgi:predicted nucleotidyltransferase
MVTPSATLMVRQCSMCYTIHVPTMTDHQRAMLIQKGVLAVIQFGSTANGTAYRKSDVDIAVLAVQPITLKDRYDLQVLLGKVYSVPVHRIDIVDLRAAHSLLSFLIISEGLPIFGSEETIDSLYRSAVKRHIDAKRLYSLDREYVRTPR